MTEKKHKTVTNTKWFTDAKFGMFIHWGLYAIPAGTWKGIDTPWVSEWIMRKLKIPVTEYEELAAKFNPEKFNAREWVKIAKNAGMKYMIITAKHHDGFAMFHSKCDKFNIVDATPYGRDPLMELTKACCEVGMKLGFYYSQDQDWHETGASGNTWDFPEKSDEAFAAYLESKVKPQLQELLTGYGKIAMIWFDTPLMIKPEQSMELKNFVYSLQPDCLVSGRVGHDMGDYGSLGDNQLPEMQLEGAWEGLGTMNESWGFKANDNEWKSADRLLETMSKLVSKNANYLLNVGPTAEGLIPFESIKPLLKMGDWLQLNGDAIYGVGPNPVKMLHQPAWGYITQKKKTINLIVFQQPKTEIVLYGIRNKIENVYCVSENNIPLEFKQEHKTDYDYHKLHIKMPSEKATKCPFVIKVDFSEELDINNNSYRADIF